MVSIIIPTKNRSSELKRAINSVLNQTHRDFEILVVDDYSDEDIKSIVDFFDDNRIYYFKNATIISNANVCRNIGLKEAKGRYVAMLDSDDEWLPDHIEKRIEFINKTGADGIFGSYYLNDGIEKKSIISRHFNSNETMANYLLSDGKAATPTHFYIANCAKDITWDESLFRHQDYDFSIRFAEKYKFIPCNYISCIVHWCKGEKRTQHLPSQLKFIEKHKNKISPVNYNNYHRTTYNIVKNNLDVDSKVKKYYQKEQTRYIHFISFVDFIQNMEKKPTLLHRISWRLIYSFRVLFKL